jgi:hypothetical protein
MTATTALLALANYGESLRGGNRAKDATAKITV